MLFFIMFYVYIEYKTKYNKKKYKQRMGKRVNHLKFLTTRVKTLKINQ